MHISHFSKYVRNTFLVSLLLADLTQEPRYRRRLCLRRSDIAHIERARARTLRMTIIIVLTFFWCWTPYVVIVLWYLFDPISADKVDSRIQSSLFMFAVSNSCVNPLVYGSYVLNFKDVLRRCFCRQQGSNTGSVANTQITTPARRAPVSEPVQRAISVNLNINGVGTYPAVVKDSIVPINSNTVQRSLSSSCGRLCSMEVNSNKNKTEAVVHSLDR